MNKFFEGFLKAGSKVSHLPLPTWAKVVIATVAGTVAVTVAEPEMAQGVAEFVMQSNIGG